MQAKHFVEKMPSAAAPIGSGTTNSAAFDSTPSTRPRISVVTRATASASALREMSLRRGDGVMTRVSEIVELREAQLVAER